MKSGQNSKIKHNDLVNTFYWSVDTNGLNINDFSASTGEAEFAIIDSGTTDLVLTENDFIQTIGYITSRTKPKMVRFTDFLGNPVGYGWDTHCDEV